MPLVFAILWDWEYDVSAYEDTHDKMSGDLFLFGWLLLCNVAVSWFPDVKVLATHQGSRANP